MAENSGTVAIVVALIGAAGLLGAKYLDIIGKPPTPVPTPAPLIDPRPAPTPAAIDPGPNPVGPSPVVQPVRPVVPKSLIDDGANVAAQAGIVDVSGAWHDLGHRDYSIEQAGAIIRLVGPLFPMGMPGTVGNGGIAWNFTDTMGNVGRCSGPLLGTQLQITCASMTGTSTFPLHRPGSG